jgi:hypothetical protein
MDATVDTGEVQLTPGMRSSVMFARPLTDGNAATVTLRTRNRQADTAPTAAPPRKTRPAFAPCARTRATTLRGSRPPGRSTSSKASN